MPACACVSASACRRRTSSADHCDTHHTTGAGSPRCFQRRCSSRCARLPTPSSAPLPEHMRFPGEKRSHRLQRGTQRALHHSTQRRLRQPCARVRVRRRTGAPGEQKSLKPSHLSGPASAMAACADLQPAGRPRRLQQRATRRRSGTDERRAAGRAQAHWGLRSFASPRTRLAAARPGTPATAAGLYGARARARARMRIPERFRQCCRATPPRTRALCVCYNRMKLYETI